MLAQIMLDAGLYDRGYFVLIAPALNYHAQDAAEAYQAQLQEPEDGKVRFINLARNWFGRGSTTLPAGASRRCAWRCRFRQSRPSTSRHRTVNAICNLGRDFARRNGATG
jgi:hypothetical protein